MMTKKDLIIEYIQQSNECKLVGSTAEETVVLRKVNDMNDNKLYQIKYELLEFTMHDEEKFDNETDFIDKIRLLYKNGAKFHNYDYYARKEIY